MNISKITTLTITSLVALIIVLAIIQFFLRKVKNKNAEDGKIKLSYGFWYITVFIAGIIITTKIISVFAEAIDIIYKAGLPNPFLEIFKVGSIFLGLGIILLIIWYYIVNILMTVIVGKRDEINELDADNYMFFLIKGIVLIGFIASFLPIFEIIIRMFMPNIEIPLYH